MMIYCRSRNTGRSSERQGSSYREDGHYLVTLYTEKRQPFLGETADGKTVLNECGETARFYWEVMPDKYKHIRLDVFTVRPDMIQGIVIIDKASLHLKKYMEDYCEGMPSVMYRFAWISSINIAPIRSDFAWKELMDCRYLKTEREIAAARLQIQSEPLQETEAG